MAADIVKGAENAVAVPDGEDAIAGDLRRHIVARRFKLRLPADPLPFPGEDLAPLLLVDVGGVVPFGRQAEGQRFVVTDGGGICVHLALRSG